MAGLYDQLSIILPNMKVIRPTTSEKLHSQSEVRWMNGQTDEQTNQ